MRFIAIAAIVGAAGMTAAPAAEPTSPARQYEYDLHCASTALVIQRDATLLSPDRPIDPAKLRVIVKNTRDQALASGKAASVAPPVVLSSIDRGASGIAGRLSHLSGPRLADARGDLGRSVIACALSQVSR